MLCAVEQAELSTVSEVLERMMNGFAVLLLDNCPTALAFGTQGFAARGVDEPDTEVMQRGSAKALWKPTRQTFRFYDAVSKRPNSNLKR